MQGGYQLNDMVMMSMMSNILVIMMGFYIY